MSDRTRDGDLMDIAPEPAPRRSRVKRHAAKAGVVLFVLLFLVVFLSQDIFITVRSGEVGVMFYRFFGGTQTARVIGEGQKIIAPWDSLFIYDVRVQEAPLQMDVLTKEGLTVSLTVSIRYHPELETVGLLHQTVGQNYRDKIVLPEVQMVLYTVVSGLEMREAYSAGTGSMQKTVNEALEQISQRFVKIDDVVLRSVVLPDEVRRTIEDKMAQKILAESYEYRLEVTKKEAERKEIEANGTRRYNEVLGASITENLLRLKGIDATLELAKSPNAKTLIVGKSDGLPLILNPDK